MSTSAPKKERPSKTAELVAAARARHLQQVSPPVFEDNLAFRMCGTFWRTVLSSRALSYLVIDVLLRDVYPIVPVIYTRARFGEDFLETAVQDGIDQYVIIGAGYDTFALRRTDLAPQLTIYELDQAATQETKLKRMQAAGLKRPEGVRYVQSDLSKEALSEALERAGFDLSRPAVFSWFGVTYYLDEETVRQTLSNIATNMAPGSSVVFDYLSDPACMDDGTRVLRDRCAAFVARRGEPWVSSFNPPDLPGLLGELGYSDVDHLAPDGVADRYFYEHDNLDYPRVMGMCRASTAPQES